MKLQNRIEVMKDVIFREYDIRGIVGTELIIEEVAPLAHAIVAYLRTQDASLTTIAVGMDGRTHASAIKEQLCSGLQACGINVIFIGLCPSPVLYFSLDKLPVQAGLMITASHNPGEYNGIKICLGQDSVWGKQIRIIRDYYKAGTRCDNSMQGTYAEQPMVPAYIDWLEDEFSALKKMPLKAVVDCGNGAAGSVLPDLVKRFEWNNVQLLYPEVDGTYPHHEADPTVEKNMLDVKHLLQTSSIEVGIGLDGDCDRMGAMTKEGFLVPGDQLLALFAQDIIAHHPGAAIVFDIKSSGGLNELINRWGGKACMSPSGHAIVKDAMKANKALLGGELSCHFMFNDRHEGHDDGIYAMMRLFEIMINTGKSLAQLIAIFPKKYNSREIRIECNEQTKQIVVNSVKDAFAQLPNAHLTTIDGVRVDMDSGWGIVRPSNTQAVIVMRFESNSPQGLQGIKQQFYTVLRPYFDEQILKSEMNI